MQIINCFISFAKKTRNVLKKYSKQKLDTPTSNFVIAKSVDDRPQTKVENYRMSCEILGAQDVKCSFIQLFIPLWLLIFTFELA